MKLLVTAALVAFALAYALGVLVDWQLDREYGPRER